ncbi:MAG: aminotransferase class V-fold PLP-dependent enzyme, partial [Nanoarchaeota archaeon]
EKIENKLTGYVLNKLLKINNLELYGLKNALNRTGVISFNIKSIHSHDIAHLLASQNIAVRAGHMCAMPLVREVLKQQAVCRISLSFYNTNEDIDSLIKAIKEIQNKLK